MTEKKHEPILIEEIMNLLPHRYPILLVDRIVEYKLGDHAVGIKNVTINEPHFLGHFPQKPIMPGVLIVEAMAQTAAVLVAKTLNEDTDGKLVYFMSIDNAKFRRPVVPGDTIHIHVKKVQNRRNVWKFDGEAKVDGKTVAEATLTAMIMDKPEESGVRSQESGK